MFIIAEGSSSYSLFSDCMYLYQWTCIMLLNCEEYAVCMCSSRCCLEMVRVSWDLWTLWQGVQWACAYPRTVLGWPKCFRILGYPEKGRWYGLYLWSSWHLPGWSEHHKISVYKRGWCGLHMCWCRCYPGMVRVFWDLCSSMVQHIFYLKNFCHLMASLDISHLDPNPLHAAS